jgi:hypothetical protein
LQKRTEVQWDIGAALGADDGADESTSQQTGIRKEEQQANVRLIKGGTGEHCDVMGAGE